MIYHESLGDCAHEDSCVKTVYKKHKCDYKKYIKPFKWPKPISLCLKFHSLIMSINKSRLPLSRLNVKWCLQNNIDKTMILAQH